MPNGKTLLLPHSTAELDKSEFQEYVTQLEAWAAEQDMGRQLGETPLEFVQRLGELVPALGGDARDLAQDPAGRNVGPEGIDFVAGSRGLLRVGGAPERSLRAREDQEQEYARHRHRHVPHGSSG